jgi:hypothetical protein
VDPERSHLRSRECIISGRGERQGAYSVDPAYVHLITGLVSGNFTPIGALWSKQQAALALYLFVANWSRSVLNEWTGK